MLNFIPILPLPVIVFPGEHLNLHITNPAYSALILDAQEKGKPFGLAIGQDKAFREFGTLAEILALPHVYKNGNLKVQLKGLRIFKILEHIESIPDKPYQGAIVDYPPEKKIRARQETRELILEEVSRLYRLLHLEKKIPIREAHWRAYDIAHKVGLSPEEEYEFFQLLNELERMEFLRRHLNKYLPVVRELEEMKRKVQLNGHFRLIK